MIIKKKRRETGDARQARRPFIVLAWMPGGRQHDTFIDAFFECVDVA